MGIDTYLNVRQKLEITVWRETDDEGFSFPSYIKDVQAHRLLVDPPGPADAALVPLLRPGYLVGVALLAPDQNPVLFYPRIQSHQTTGLIGYWLEYTAETQLEVIQRRQHARVPITLPISGQALGEDEQWTAFEGLSLNLSGGGLRFVSPCLFELHQEVQLSFRFSDEVKSSSILSARQTEVSPLLRVKGRVVFSQLNVSPIGGAGEVTRRYLTAVQFTHLSEEQEVQIVRECFRRELKARRISPNP